MLNLLFEKQSFQENCVANIIKVLDDTDILNDDYSAIPKAVEKLNKENQQTQFITSKKNKIDVLMETGTGKTFTYIKTIFEINKQYGKNRFIIVVPRTAIKAGIIQNIKLTKEYFFNEYHTHLNIINYPDDGTSKIENDFLNDDKKITVLVLTNSSFNSDNKLIKKTPESGTLFVNGNLWDNISNKKPIVIIDEPHLLKGDETQKSFNKLHNSLFIRFGATYPNENNLSDDIKLSNVAYSLDSVTAFNEYLVKRIAVNTIFSDSDLNTYKLSKIEARQKKFKLSYFIDDESFSMTLSLHQDIGVLTGIKSLNGIHAVKVDKDTVYLSNEKRLVLQTKFNLSEDEVRLMIRQTIKKHFEKEQKLFKDNIKVLSLFFIPNVSDFRGANPIIKTIFEEEYLETRFEIYDKTNNEEYKKYLERDFDDGTLCVHQGYFSGDKGKDEDQKISKGIDDILNNKEKLLSLNNPLRFIFSVWALQEGWDNPNIFNICKLSNTDKETSRRQQVGRGLRIAVNKENRRLTYKYLNEDDARFYDINTLDMFVSHYELDFIENIQKEIQDSSFCITGDIVNTAILMEKGLQEREANRLLTVLEDNNIILYSEKREIYEIQSSIYSFLMNNQDKLQFIDENRLEEIKAIFKEVRPSVDNGNKAKPTVGIRKDKLDEFKELWEAINKKSKLVYSEIKDEIIIEAIATKFNQEDIQPITIKMFGRFYNSQTNQIINKNEETISEKIDFFKEGDYQDFIYSFTKDERLKLPLPFVLCLLNKLDITKIRNNPQKAKSVLKDLVIAEIHRTVIQNIDYDFENEIKITSLHDPITKQYLTEIKHTVLGVNSKLSSAPAPDNLLYDTIVYESDIEKNAQENDPLTVGKNKIIVFAKLPNISIPTPYKTYNPDFAYLINKSDGKKLFLVVETKGYESELLIPIEQQKKINYAKKFFHKLQQQLPDIQIEFKTRINKQGLIELLEDIERGCANNDY